MTNLRLNRPFLAALCLLGMAVGCGSNEIAKGKEEPVKPALGPAVPGSPNQPYDSTKDPAQQAASTSPVVDPTKATKSLEQIPVTVTQFFFAQGITKEKSPKITISASEVPENSSMLQFSVLLKGNIWPKCFYFHVYRADKKLGEVYHCHEPKKKELEAGTAYIGSQPILSSWLKRGEGYRVDLFSDNKLLGSYPFSVVSVDSTKPIVP